MKTWKTKDNRVLNICDMETSHIKNAINMLERNGYIKASVYTSFLTRSKLNGDMAQLAFENALDEAMSKNPTTHLDWLYEELNKRVEE